MDTLAFYEKRNARTEPSPLPGDFRLPKNYLAFRRALELLALLVCSPLILAACFLTALAVRLDSPGPIFFAQLRPGRDGKLFKMWKFRSMRPLRAGENFRLTASDDERVTAVGRIIRRWRLDELPQFWNILRGDMSLIGPRPVPSSLYERYKRDIPGYDLRHLVRPGITGLAQVRQGYTETAEAEAEKWRLDMLYIRQLSPGTDASVVWHTLKTIASGFGAR